jgi:Rrf2 family transcriptional regulator, iron-sulfur cluster assembly transcription factor
MRLQTSTTLAIFAVLELASHAERQQSVAAIGEKFDVSSHHLAKVMNELARAGMVQSVRGAGGGYQFVGNPRRTTLYDIIRLFEDVQSEEESKPSAESRALADVLHEIDDIALATLGSITIATMCKIVEARRNGKTH